MTDPTGTEAAKPATVFVTSGADTVHEEPTATDAVAPATRFVVSPAREAEPDDLASMKPRANH